MTEWVKSSYSGDGGSNCVEWAPSTARTGAVPVRDSKDLGLAPLSFGVDAFAAFVDAVKDGKLGA